MKTTFGTLFQREFSLRDNIVRARPMHPLRRERGVIHIGNRRIPVERAPRYWTQAELEVVPNQPRSEAIVSVMETQARHR